MYCVVVGKLQLVVVVSKYCVISEQYSQGFCLFTNSSVFMLYLLNHQNNLVASLADLRW